MVTYHQVRDVLERALSQHGPNACAPAGAVAELGPHDQRNTAYWDVYDKLSTTTWPPPRGERDVARLAWRALPQEVRWSS